MEKSTDMVGFTQIREESLPVMAERRVSDIMRQGDRLDQVFIEMEQAADSPGDLGYKLHVQDSMGNVIVLDEIEDLGLVYIAGVGQGMENPIRINRETLSVPLLDVGVILFSYRVTAETGPL